MGLLELLQHLAPAALAHAKGLVEVSQRGHLLGREEADAAPQGVAHEHREAVAVVHDGLLGAGRQLTGQLARGLPLVHEAGVRGADNKAQPGHDVVQVLGALVGRHGLVEHAPGVGEVAQQRALAARELVALDVGLEVAHGLEHVSHDGLGAQAEVSRPGHLVAVGGKGRLELLLQRLGVGDVLELFHAFVVLDALHLHLGDGAALGIALLGAQHLPRVLERGLHHGDEVHVVGLALRVEQLEGREQEGREGLVQREVLGQVNREGVAGRRREWRGGSCGQQDGELLELLGRGEGGGVARLGGRACGSARTGCGFRDPRACACCGCIRSSRTSRAFLPRDDAGVDEGRKNLVRTGHELRLLGVGLQRVRDEAHDAGVGVPALARLREHHGVRDAQARRERLGRRGAELLEGVLVPVHEAFRRALLLELAQLLGISRGLELELCVLNLVLGRLGDDAALGVEARAAGAAGNLVELAGVQAAHAVAVVFGERCE